MLYPEIFDTKDYDAWKRKYLRKELLSKEWDLMLREPFSDFFEVPFFTEEFCDKFIINMEDIKLKPIDRWGTEMNGTNLENIRLMDTMKKLVEEFCHSIASHEWHTYGKKWQEMNISSMLLTMDENQDLRPRHDFVSISNYIRLDNDSEGGELVFTKSGNVINPKKGHLLIFPGQVTHRYGIRKIKKGKRVFLMNYCIGE
tara:strand:- start:1750 stop:2349 length:600 start_codon:yes stop_codon:yes gene_type:complete